MKSLKKLYLYLIFCTMICCFSYEAKGQSNLTTSPNVESLRKEAIPIRTIEPTDEDFSDLLPIANKIGNSRVVVLGESTHSEGATTQAKARMVRFLHQKMGFTVLAWEAGLLDCWRLNEAIRSSDISVRDAAQYMMRGGWDASAYTQPIFEYARASWKTSRPLEMAGFDTARPPRGAVNYQELLVDFFSRAPSLSFTGEEMEVVKNLFSRAGSLLNVDNAKIPDEERKRGRDLLEGLREKLKKEHLQLLKNFSERELLLIERGILTALKNEQRKYDFGKYLLTKDATFGKKSSSDRDEFMADNFIWLTKQMYPNQKIVIWAATAHLTRNTPTIEPIDKTLSYKGVAHMGDFVHKELGQELYTIAFTAFNGELGSTYTDDRKPSTEPLKKAPEDSFEAFAHGVGQPYLFVDLRRIEANHWLRSPITALPLGFSENKADWSKVIDAFFFIDTMTPNLILPRIKS